MQRPVRVTAPAAVPVSLSEAKAHLRVEHTDDDAIIGRIVDAAVGHLDGWSGVLGRCLVTQTWRVSFRDFDGRMLRLPFADVSAIEAVVYRDADDVEQTVDPSDYALNEDAQGSYLFMSAGFDRPAVFHRPDAVTVRFVAGYGDATAVPAALKAAMLLHIGHMYENRESVVIGQSVTGLPMAYDALVAPYRVRRF